jgi:hypothetical protein
MGTIFATLFVREIKALENDESEGVLSLAARYREMERRSARPGDPDTIVSRSVSAALRDCPLPAGIRVVVTPSQF